jgi:hypothetical protein
LNRKTKTDLEEEEEESEERREESVCGNVECAWQCNTIAASYQNVVISMQGCKPCFGKVTSRVDVISQIRSDLISNPVAILCQVANFSGKHLSLRAAGSADLHETSSQH